MKRLVMSLVLMFLLLTVVAAFDGYIVVTNNTGFDIIYLYISHEDAEDWEEDVLGDEILADGEYIQIDIEGYETSIFDVSAEDEDGDSYTLWGIDIETDDVILTLDDLD